MKEDKSFSLRKNISKAAAIRNLCHTPGFTILREAFEEKVERATKKILDPEVTDDEVKQLRRKVQIWHELEKLLKELMMKGELSKRALEIIDLETSPEVNTDKEK